MKLNIKRFAISASNSTTLKSSAGNKATLRVTFTENSTSTANNTSSITATAGIKMNTGSYSGVSSPYLYVYWHSNVNNTDYELGRLNITALSSSEKTVSGTKSDVGHYSDGTASGYAWAQWSYSGSSKYVPKGGTVATSTTALTTIPRASSVSATTANIGANSTVTINRASSSFTHTLTYSFANGSVTGTIATKTTSTSVSFTLPTSLYAKIPSANSITGTITCTTYSGNTAIGTSSCNVTANVPSTATPTVSVPTITDTDTISKNTIGLYVQGKSKLQFNFANSFSSSYNATLKAYTLKINGTQVYSGTNTSYTMVNGLPNTSNTYELIVTDSRNKTATTGSKTITAYAYSEPTASIEVERNSTTPTTVNIKYSGTITNINNNNKNAKSFKIEFKQSNASSWTTVTTATDAYSKTNVAVTKTGVDDSHGFDFRLTVTDSYGSVTATDTIGTSFTLMNFNADGTGLAFGKASETSNTFECALDADFTGDVKKNGTDILQPAYNRIGTLSNLNTSVKTNLVNAINVLAPGEIVDSALSDGNGYIKYSNGFMIQWKLTQVTAGGTQWTNAIFISNHNMGNWTTPFTSIFSFWTSCNSYDFWTSAGGVNTTSVGILRCYRPTSTTASVYVGVTAIGMWK